MKLASQIILLAFVALTLFRTLKEDFDGRPAREPSGYKGAWTTIVAIVLVCFLYYKAGALSLIIGE